MSIIPFFPCNALNAGGASDDTRYSLARIVALAESLARGVVKDAAPVAITERATGSADLLALFDAMLPPSQTEKGKDAMLGIRVPSDTEGEVVKRVTVASIRDALSGLVGESADFAVVNGTSRTLASVLLWACGISIPALPTVTVEGTDAELRDLSAQGNSVNSYAKAMSYGSRIAYALGLYDSGVASEAEMMRRANVGRGIAQLMWAAAVAIRKHGVDATTKLDKEGWRKVAAVEAGDKEAVEAALQASEKADTRTLTLKVIYSAADRAPAGVAGDVMRAIAADDKATLARLLGIAI
jgi:hypothetical protein